MTHRLRRRYGRAKGHLPLSRISLDAYQHELKEALQHLRLHAGLSTTEERLMELHGWQNGNKPITVALKIERLRKKSKR